MNNKPAVVLVHGLWMNRWSMMCLGRYFKAQNYSVYYFSYPSVRQNIETNSIALANFLDKLSHRLFDLVGHSMGGIICLDYMVRNGADKVKHCALLGTPVYGSVAAQGLGRWRLGRALLGEGGADLIQAHDVVACNKLGLIIGTGGKGLGRFFAPLPFPHDGAVAVREARIKEVKNQMLLSTSHSTMLFSKPVAKSVVYFCQYGTFPE